METARAKVVNRPPTSAPAAARVIQRKALRVSSSSDPAEREAESTARRVARMPLADASIRHREGIFRSPLVQKSSLIQRKAEGQPDTGANIEAEIQSSTTEGAPLPLSVRRFMEPRFRADFRNVRMHNNEKSAALNTHLGARA
ncbi:MAG TPA: DUF4157 domain-containing protein, partial [Longimicrobiales bacterium]